MRPFLLAMVVVAGACAGFAQPSASISITVLDEQQSPLPGAWVTANHAGEFEDMWPGQCTTGPDGVCTMQIQGPGRFALQASKWQDDYPDKNKFYFGRGIQRGHRHPRRSELHSVSCAARRT